MCGQEGKSSKSLSEPQVQLQQLRQPCRATLWSSHRAQQSWSPGLLPPNNPAKILPPSSSHFLFSLLFCQLSKLTQSILELKEHQKQCQGGAGHWRPGRGGGYGEHGALPLLSVGQCCPTYGAALPITSAWQKLVIYPDFTLPCLGEQSDQHLSLHQCVVSLSNVTTSCHSHPLTQWFSVLIFTLDIHQESE